MNIRNIFKLDSHWNRQIGPTIPMVRIRRTSHKGASSTYITYYSFLDVNDSIKAVMNDLNVALESIELEMMHTQV